MPVLSIKRCNKNLAALLTSLFLLTGCASTPVSFNSRDYLAENQATLFIYRPDALANVLVNPAISINGVTTFTLGNNQYQTLQIPAGQHTIKLDLPERYSGNTDITLETANAHAYFLRIDTAIKFQQNRPYERSFDLLEVTEAQASPQISLCKPSTGAKNASAAPNPAEKSPGYSNQLFRNPFSH